MSKSLNYKLAQIRLIARIFYCVTPIKLYSRVISNSYKNLLRLYTPSSAVLGLTYRCQCKCVHCSAGLYEKKKERELTTEEWIKIIDRIHALGVPRINLSGGEALLRGDIFEILTYASKKFVVILESNGQLLTEENARRLRDTGVSCVAVSIDSDDSHTHDSLRNLRGCFDKAVKGIDNLTGAGVPCLISTYINSKRLDHGSINNLMELARKKRALAVRVMPARPVGSFSCHVDSLLDKDAEELVLRMIDPGLAYFKGIPAPSRCGIFCKATFYVSPYGEIQPCPYLPLSFGTTRQESLSEVLKRMWGHDIFKGNTQDCLILNNDFRKKMITPYLRQGDSEGVFPIEIK